VSTSLKTLDLKVRLTSNSNEKKKRFKPLGINILNPQKTRNAEIPTSIRDKLQMKTRFKVTQGEH
jgi:hypothetical protein